MERRLALTNEGDITYCTSSAENVSKGRCNHVAHQFGDESPNAFLERISSSGSALQKMSTVTRELAFIPEDTTVITTPYRMTDEEKMELTKIENRMQLDQNIDGGYMEVEEPLWNDMDKNAFLQGYKSNLTKKELNAILHGESFIILSESADPLSSKKFPEGLVVSGEKLEEYKDSGYPQYFNEDIRLETGVKAMNEFADKYEFKATKDIFVLPYYMRQGVSEIKQYETSSTDAGDQEFGDMISNDLTVGYKYLLRNAANPEKQQLAYEALLDNASLDEQNARWQNGWRNRSLADQFAGKGGVFRAVLSGNSVPYVGRAVLTPSSDLKIDETAVPASICVDIYRPELLRQLSREGFSSEGIGEYIDQFRVPQTEIPKEARNDLQKRISGLRVCSNRQPSLHQSSFQAFKPVVSEDATIKMNPLCYNAYNADNDGDQMVVYGITPGFDDTLIKKIDEAIGAKQKVNTTIPRAHNESSILPTKDALFGLLSILEQRK